MFLTGMKLPFPPKDGAPFEKLIAEASPEVLFHIHFIRWFVQAQYVSLRRSGFGLNQLLAIAKRGGSSESRRALFYAMATDKMVFSLRWVQQLFLLAQTKGDKPLLGEFAKALKAPSIPPECRGDIFDLHYASLGGLLTEVSLSEQAAIFNSAGIRISEQALRHRRSRFRRCTQGNEKRSSEQEQQPEIEHLLRSFKNLKPGHSASAFFLPLYGDDLGHVISEILPLNPRLVN
jgi:hypothetical protein